MAGRKKKEAPDNALVQKARPFFNLWQYGFKLFDYKVFDLYLGMIDSHKPSTRILTFTKNDFSKILDVSEGLSAQELDKKLETLVSKVISIDTNSTYPIRTTLFASAYVDTTMEPFTVQLEVSEKLLELVFHIDNENGKGYFKYRLRNVLNIESVYSYLMFNFLQAKAQRSKGDILLTTFTADIEYLKKVLNCADNKTYEDFRYFKDKVLNKCHKEITGKTELQYSYKTIKQGRFVKAIEFTIEPFKFSKYADPIIEESTLELLEVQAEPVEAVSELVELLLDSCDNAFSPLQIQLLIATMADMQIPPSPYGAAVAKFNYLRKKYLQLKVIDQQNPIKNKFSYLLRMIENDK